MGVGVVDENVQGEPLCDGSKLCAVGASDEGVELGERDVFLFERCDFLGEGGVSFAGSGVGFELDGDSLGFFAEAFDGRLHGVDAGEDFGAGHGVGHGLPVLLQGGGFFLERCGGDGLCFVRLPKDCFFIC